MQLAQTPALSQKLPQCLIALHLSKKKSYNKIFAQEIPFSFCRRGLQQGERLSSSADTRQYYSCHIIGCQVGWTTSTSPCSRPARWWRGSNVWHVAKKLRGPALLSGSIEENTRSSRFFQTQSPEAKRIYMRFLFFFLSRHSNPFCRRASEIKPHHLFTVIFWLCTNGVISSGLPGSVEGFWFPEQADASWCGEVRGIWLALGSWYFKAKMWLGRKRITREVLHSFTAMPCLVCLNKFWFSSAWILCDSLVDLLSDCVHSTPFFKKICPTKRSEKGCPSFWVPLSKDFFVF